MLDIHELAAILKRSPETIRKDLSRNSQAVPPCVIMPGTRLLHWRVEDVNARLGQHASVEG
ncbi:hypothetical protein [Aquitalea pelogenes]|uniref:hypothetical protein n=1 Tax=Aquitalea pelogenes TaxID=1293573 RepID=UPI0035B49A43